MNKIKEITKTLYLDTDEVAAISIIPPTKSGNPYKMIIYLKNGKELIEKADLQAINEMKNRIIN